MCFQYCDKNVLSVLQTGDFRSGECIELLKEADIVVTNPPFSLFREFIGQLMKYQKSFLIIGNVNAITYKEIFPLIKTNKLWLGPSITSGDRKFNVPDDYSLNAFVYMPCEPNTTYTIGGAAGANNLMIGTTSVIPTAGTVVSGTTNGAIRSITTASDAKYLLILVLRDTDGATTSNRDSIIAENVANMYVRTGGYTISGTSPSDHDSVSDCKITCEGGSYLASANALTCRDVGSGYWAAQSVISQGDTGIRNKCESGLTTIGYGAGADELGDCGRVLHVGEHQIYLRSDKKTTPSLNVGINGVVYYSNMSTEVDGNLKIKYNDLIYSVYDDSM